MPKYIPLTIRERQAVKRPLSYGKNDIADSLTNVPLARLAEQLAQDMRNKQRISPSAGGITIDPNINIPDLFKDLDDLVMPEQIIRDIQDIFSDYEGAVQGLGPAGFLAGAGIAGAAIILGYLALGSWREEREERREKDKEAGKGRDPMGPLEDNDGLMVIWNRVLEAVGANVTV